MSTSDAMLVLAGREKKKLGDDATRHVALLRVTLETNASRYQDDDLRCVAERAVDAASSAYNLASTRIVDVALMSIDEADAA